MSADRPPDDPVFLHARREAVVMLLVWAASFAWTVPYCYFNGYDAPGDLAQLQLVLGMPAWVFWGILVPWIVFGVIAILLCLYFIQDDDLEPAASQGREPPDDVGLTRDLSGG
jgi:hypothetical protein